MHLEEIPSPDLSWKKIQLQDAAKLFAPADTIAIVDEISRAILAFLSSHVVYYWKSLGFGLENFFNHFFFSIRINSTGYMNLCFFPKQKSLCFHVD